MNLHSEQNALILDILSQLARKNNKSLERIKRLLLINQNAAINRQFWNLLDQHYPGHGYEYVGCCPDCGLLELV